MGRAGVREQEWKTTEAAAPEQETEAMERFVDAARDATERAYLFLRGDAAAAAELARALTPSAEQVYSTGHGAQAARLVERLVAELDLPEGVDPESFRRGVRAGFAAGCLTQWRVLEYLVGEEMPLWPVERSSVDRQVD